MSERMITCKTTWYLMRPHGSNWYHRFGENISIDGKWHVQFPGEKPLQFSTTIVGDRVGGKLLDPDDEFWLAICELPDLRVNAAKVVRIKGGALCVFTFKESTALVEAVVKIEDIDVIRNWFEIVVRDDGVTSKFEGQLSDLKDYSDWFLGLIEYVTKDLLGLHGEK